MKTDRVFDGTSGTPVDGLAARVASKGFQYKPKKKVVQCHWGAPPEMRRVPRGVPNLTGVSFGGFRVMGLYTGTKHRGGALWVVRCVCGDYETRSSRAIKNPKNAQDCCELCRHVAYLRQCGRTKE